MIKVIDDFLPSDQFEQISINLMGKDFPWYWNNFVNDRNEQHEHGQFTHGFFNYKALDNPWGSIWGELLEGFIDSFTWKEMLRIKANMIPRTANNIVSGYHVDQPFPHKVGILYINTNNGSTIFENGDKIDCVANRMVFFDGDMRHSSVTATDQYNRVVINLNYT
jgi:hypothetical protein|tara:strand:+ start:239 stop:733 length:495 start_codon:yes stop_codon:yes gene_type:complete